jgi:hypothetical protein
MAAGPHCTWTGVSGTVFDVNGLPMGGVQIKLWGENGWQGPVVTTSGDGLYEIQISGGPTDGTWWVQIIENGRPASVPIGFRTSGGGCDAGTGKQRFQLDWSRVR